MESSTFRELAEKANVPWVKKVFALISGRAGEGYVADAKASPLQHTPQDIDEIRGIVSDAVSEARAADGVKRYTIDEVKQELRGDLNRWVRDGFWNPLSGVGSADDPGMFNFAYTPVAMFPQEATAYYSSGGIPQVIVDKKAKGILVNGYGFEGKGWTPDELEVLHDYGEKHRFGEAISNAVRDGLVYGGAVAYPQLKRDNVETLSMSIDELLAWGILKQDSIDYFVTTDRWNTVLVPNWNVTARDYLFPRHYYIPIGGVKVATERSGVVRPKMLPYWGMLPQMGWGISDYEGYIASILGYQIMMAAIPIMAQQMSLMIHEIPLDGIIAQNGVEAAKDFLRANQDALNTWSMLHPRAINSYGKVSVIERHYEGFKDLVTALQTDIGARSELPSTVIFPAQPTGLASDREQDVLLKAADAVQKIAVAVIPQFKAPVRMLAISCFGPDYFRKPENAEKLATLTLTFESPTVQTAEQRADAGAKFAQMVSAFTSAQMPLDVAVDMTHLFFEEVEIPDEIMQRIEQAGMEGTPEEWIPSTPLVDLLARGGLVQQLAAGGNGNGNGQGHVADEAAAHAEERLEELRGWIEAKLGEVVHRQEVREKGLMGALRKAFGVSGRVLRDEVREVADELKGVTAQVDGVRVHQALDRPAQPITVNLPEIKLAPEIRVEAPKIQLPEIKVEVQNAGPEPQATVTTFDYEVDERGVIRPGTVKATKVPVKEKQ